MKKWLLSFSAIMLVLLMLSGCGKAQEKSAQTDQLTVYTTVYPLQYLTEQIGGKYVNVKTIYPPGSDAHSFEPTQKDMLKIADSKLFFYIGLGMEGFVNKAKDTLKSQDVKFIPLAEKLKLPKDPDANIEAEDDHEHANEKDHHHGDINPHVWLNPVYMEQMAKLIKDELIKQMPKQKQTFTKNYQTTVKQLENLNDQYKKMAQKAKHKDFVTAHAAYSYWDTEYGLHQIPIAGISTSDEPSQKKLKEIVKTIKAKKIPYIMLEQNTNSKIADVIQQETDTKTLKLHNLETLTQKDINQKRDYMSIMKDNLAALKTALNN